MRIMHLSDLHIGKRVNDYSMLEDQVFALKQLVKMLKDEGVDVLLIAGDIYDKGIPTSEAVMAFDDFINDVAHLNVSILMISGNHDSGERLSFGNKLMEQAKVYISSLISKEVKVVSLEDQFGVVNFYLVPFLKPSYVTNLYGVDFDTYTAAFDYVLKQHPLNKAERNILIAHQFVVDGNSKPQESESEVKRVGGIDEIDASIFSDFDYVALGHLHAPQHIKARHIRYGGSLLKYSFSESKQNKDVTILNLNAKGHMDIEKHAITYLHDMREIMGELEVLMSEEVVKLANPNDYIHAIITNEEDIIDALGKLRSVYPNIMKIDFDNQRTKTNNSEVMLEKMQNKSALELFNEFYYMQNNVMLSDQQSAIVAKQFAEIEAE